MILVTNVVFVMLSAAALLCVARLVRPGSLADRIVALDTLLVITVCGIAAYAARTGDGMFLDATVVGALLGFIGAVTVARYIERRGA